MFLSGLRFEIDRVRSVIERRTIETIYLGGGTPTCLAPGQMRSLFTLLFETIKLPVTPTAEITVEANPNTASDHMLSLLLARGVNRMSIGVQSFCDSMLRVLGRIHTSREAVSSVLRARKSGFGNISIDLIYGIPGQTTALWRETVERAIDLGTEHISSYCLSLDEGSLFQGMAAEGAISLPDDETIIDMHDIAAKRFNAAGYVQYELSNFAKPGFECKHNKNYWNRGEYLGLGPGAWTFLRGKRSCTVNDIAEYQLRLSSGLSIETVEDISTVDEAAREYIMLGLRTIKGIDLRSFRLSFGRKTYETLIKNLELHSSKGLVRISNGRLCLTGSGKMLADEAIQQLFP